MDIINLSIRSIELPSDKKLKATSYQVANTGLFRDEDIVVDNKEDTKNLYEYDVELDFTKADIYFARVKLHFDDDTYYGWTKPIVLTKDGDGFSHNNTVIVTPTVTVTTDINNAVLGGFRIMGSEFIIFTGHGNHLATSWVIKDSLGAIIWEKIRDESNLREIRVPNNILKPNRIYSVEVTYIANNNMMSNPGRIILKTSGNMDNVENLVFKGVKPILKENEDYAKTLEQALQDYIYAEMKIANLENQVKEYKQALDSCLNKYSQAQMTIKDKNDQLKKCGDKHSDCKQ